MFSKSVHLYKSKKGGKYTIHAQTNKQTNKTYQRTRSLTIKECICFYYSLNYVRDFGFVLHQV